MKIIKFIVIALLLFSMQAFGQIENLRTHTQMNLDCKKCHICDTPTKANPCLIACPRNKIEVVRHSPSEGPDNIIIEKIEGEEDLYGPSYFTHKLHSEMSLMSGGCSICHHFNPPGKIVKCSNCHETRRTRTDLSKPDLKAAFHRQCMNCHKSWEKDSKCENCHTLKSDVKKIDSKAEMKNVHPKIEIPIKVVYETDSDEGKMVTFFHNDHSSIFGYECNDCHTEEACANCHSEFVLETIKADVHDRCSTCHDTEDKCNDCHKGEIAKPFDHFKKTKFRLAGWHANLSCASCHKTKNKFTGLDSECTGCHMNSEGYFKHRITGLQLNETHMELECSDCHDAKNYSKKPTCDACHDEDIYYPDSQPGEMVR